MKTLFLIGQNARGQWVAQTQAGHRGGLFVNQAAAVKFAMMENGHRKDAIVNVPALELDLGGPTLAVVHSAPKLPVAITRAPQRPAPQPAIPQAA
jgi:hypothetical protein